MSRIRPTKLRMTFSFRSGKVTREKIRGFADALAQDVAFNASELQWREIRTKLEKQIGIDVRREISKMAQLYKQFVIGIAPGRTGMIAKLETASQPAKGQERHASYRAVIDWPRRTRSYLNRKGKNPPRGVGHKRWFLHDEVLKNSMGAGSTWTAAFGPVVVDVKRVNTMSVTEAQNLHRADKEAGHNRRMWTDTRAEPGSIIRVHVASIRVSALESITPKMLPAMRSGDISDMPPDGRQTGLIDHFPANIARHLAGSAQEANFVPYRHTIEPFLGFVLTRAIPNALAARIQSGLGAKVGILRS